MTNDGIQFLRNRFFKVKKTIPPMVLVHSRPGMGKSTLGSEFPRPIFLMTEISFPYEGVDIMSIPVKNLADFHACLDNIEISLEEHQKKKDDEGFKPLLETLVIDHLSGIENFIIDEITKTQKIKTVGDLPYGKGYELISHYWSSLSCVEAPKSTSNFIGIIPRLRKIQHMYNICILLLAHSKIKTISNPGEEPREMFIPMLTKQAEEQITRSVDEIIYISPSYSPSSNGLLRSTGFVFNSGNGQPTYESKTRCGLPIISPYQKGRGFEELSKYLPKWYSKEV